MKSTKPKRGSTSPTETDADLFSISRLAQLSGMDRKTVSARIRDIEPDRNVRGYPAYSLKNAGPAIWGETYIGTDPEKMSPYHRKLHYEAEIKKVLLGEALGKLIPAEEVRMVLADTFRILVKGFENLPDELERDLGMTAEQCKYVKTKINAMRQSVYTKLMQDPDE